jgi:DeoR/GlpR family transcriptional regulator of sugar metabolism
MGAGSGSRGGRGREAPSASTRAARTGRGAQTLASVRRERILESLRLAGAVSLGELAEMLAVSDMTVRRDLEALQSDGLIERVRGGAVVPQRGTDEPGFDMKLQRQSREKRAIADVAATMVRSGAAIGLSAGTTTWALARRLATTTGITVVTNSMNVWGELQHRDADGPSAVLSGGEFRTPSDALVGPTADITLRSVYVDILFLGVHGLHPVAGLTTPNVSEAETNRTFISRARRLVVVADHTKWQTSALCTMAELDAVDTLITDDGIGADARQALASRVGELRVAPVNRA